MQYADGMFDIDFNKLYPDALPESYAYVSTYIYSVNKLLSEVLSFLNK